MAARKKTEEELLEEIIKDWRQHPLKFVEEGLGLNAHNGYAITQQQKDYFNKVGILAHAKKKMYDYRQGHKDRWKISDEEKDYAKKMGVSIMSGKGTGKNFAMSCTLIWFLFCFQRSKIICCAPRQEQLKKNMWAEVAKVLSLTSTTTKVPIVSPIIRQSLQVESEKIYMRGGGQGEVKDGMQWFAFMACPQKHVDKEKMKSTLSGNHEENMMFLIDEAAGVEDAVFEPLENTMTDRINFIIMAFNPSKNSGFAYGTHYGRHSEKWVKLHWDGEQCERIDKQHVLNLEYLYGRDSDNFRVNVTGLPPRGEDDALIPHQWIYEAVQREIKVDDNIGIVMGVDVSEGGSDTTIVTVRHGYKVLEQVKINAVDSIDQAQEIMDVVDKYRRELGMHVDGICVDSIAVGRGVFDQLRRMFSKTYSVKGSNASSDTEKFRRKRDELYWKMREAFEQGLMQIPDDHALIEELSIIRINRERTHESGQTVVESKDKILKRLGRSPDRADSLMLSFFLHEAYSRGESRGETRYGRGLRGGRSGYKGQAKYDLGSKSWLLA